MDVKRFYDAIGSDYKSVEKRLGNLQTVEYFVEKFTKDLTFSQLENAMDSKSAEDAFRAAHTLKGLSLNLGLDNLYKISYELTEKLRAKNLTGTEELFKKAKEQYDAIIKAANT